MASKAQYLKKRTVMKLSDILNRKFDPGQGNPKTVNPNKKKSAVPRKPDYFSEAVQGLAYKAGLVDKPSAQAVREEAYGTKRDVKAGGPKNRKPLPKAKPKGYTPLVNRVRPETPGAYMPKKVPGGARPEVPGSYMPKKSSSAVATSATTGSGTSTGAAEKLSNFERQKARQYERDVGPSTMSKKRIMERIQKERQYKSPFGGLFNRKGK